MTAGIKPLTIVGIGASAAGLQALTELFRSMPVDSGMAFVAVTHQSPGRTALLDQILQRHTAMPVSIAEDGVRVEPNHVYIGPPDTLLRINSGCLKLAAPESGTRERHPIDIFFTSLAEDWGDHAIAIILSGFGSDGTLGLKIIKQCGGVTITQTSGASRPSYPGMPDSAIHSGLADLAIPVEEMPSKLMDIINGPAGGGGISAHLDRIYSILSEKAGNDFSGYKTKTVKRRVPFAFERDASNVRLARARQLRERIEAHVNERFAPSHLVVNEDGDIIHYSPRTGKYLEPSVGSPSRKLADMARKSLRLELRTALAAAINTKRMIVREAVPLEDEAGRVQFVTLTIDPMPAEPGGDQLFVVLFKDEAERTTPGRPGSDEMDKVALLDRELMDTRERLQAIIEEYETALEELKASNEELVSVNEEFQSANEELEPSKEEMQFVNEELETVNVELNSKVDELDRANNDLRNLFNCTTIAIVFVDANLLVRNYTPAASSFFNLIEGDRGRPLTHLAHNLDYPDLRDDLEQVLATGKLREREVNLQGGGARYLIRVTPYFDALNAIQGAVVSLVDITSTYRSIERLRLLIQELNHRVKNMLTVVISIAKQSARGATSLESFFEGFEGRLFALSRSHNLIARENWGEVPFEEIIRGELQALRSGRVQLEGPSLKLGSSAAVSFGMIIHELATNAVKHGSLKEEHGSLSLSWSVVPGKNPPELIICWREQGAGNVKAPDKKGFGLTLVEVVTNGDLEGHLSLEFLSQGLMAEITVPMRAIKFGSGSTESTGKLFQSL